MYYNIENYYVLVIFFFFLFTVIDIANLFQPPLPAGQVQGVLGGGESGGCIHVGRLLKQENYNNPTFSFKTPCTRD